MLALGIPIQVIEFRTSSDLSDPNSPFYDGSDDDDLPLLVDDGMSWQATSDGEGSKVYGDRRARLSIGGLHPT
jgi:hypothetical protein